MAKKYDEDLERVVEEIVEDLPKIDEIIEPVKVSAKTYTAIAGDTFPSIAAKFKPTGKSKHEYATELVAKNGSLSVGKVVVL